MSPSKRERLTSKTEVMVASGDFIGLAQTEVIPMKNKSTVLAFFMQTPSHQPIVRLCPSDLVNGLAMGIRQSHITRRLLTPSDTGSPIHSPHICGSFLMED
jgi:hypothetical protein